MPAEAAGSTPIDLRIQNGRIWSHLRQKWLVETPEERVRQEYLLTLVDQYGYSLDQMDEEVNVTGRGSGKARADFLIWRSPADKRSQTNPLIVVECKANNISISREDYWQGENYARLTNARFFVTHNARETKYWRVNAERMPKTAEEIENIPHAHATDREVQQLVDKLKVFRGDEFADLLHRCHNVIRNREKKDPAAAFDEIAKILFVKVWVERQLKERRQRRNLFSVEVLAEQLGSHPLDFLFQQTKEVWASENLFDEDERINLRPSTAHEIVHLLERYNLSDTGADIKGIAFERFLGRTFRGEIGQFFTPRTIVEFMVQMLDPQEGERVSDPASGSGGFLIRFFEIVREQILQKLDAEYEEFRETLLREKPDLKDTERARLLREKWDAIQRELDPTIEGSRVWRLSNDCIFGTDANERMARTSKMNMIMHGDGHGGIHHHDGFLDVDGIFPGRFDLVLTNPPFGSNVEPSDVVTEGDIEELSAARRQRLERLYGEGYRESRARLTRAIGHPIASLFQLPKKAKQTIRTEILFLERSLELLRPGGRLGIVLPEGILNNPSLAYVRQFCEERAYIKAVVSLPQDTFKSAKAQVKPSLVFMQKFTDADRERYQEAWLEAQQRAAEELPKEEKHELSSLVKNLEQAKAENDRKAARELKSRLSTLQRETHKNLDARTRRLHRELFDYPVFLYEADKVGITATGEPDLNELYPNEDKPPEAEKTCLELYQEFLKSSWP